MTVPHPFSAVFSLLTFSFLLPQLSLASPEEATPTRNIYTDHLFTPSDIVSIWTVIQTVTATATVTDSPSQEPTEEVAATVSASVWKTGDPVTCEIDYVQYLPKPLPTAPGIAISYAHTETVTDKLACEGCALVVDVKTAGLRVRKERRTAVLGPEEKLEVTVTIALPVTTVTTQACSNGEPVISVGAPNKMPLHTFEYSKGAEQVKAEATSTTLMMATATQTEGKGKRDDIWHEERPHRPDDAPLLPALGATELPHYKKDGSRDWHACDFFWNIC